MSANNLSSINQQFIQKASQGSMQTAQTPLYTAPVAQSPAQGQVNLINSPKQDTFIKPAEDTFIKKNKKKIVLGSIVGAAALLGGAFLLAKSGKLGQRLQSLVGGLSDSGTKLTSIKDGKATILNSEGKNFYSLAADGTKKQVRKLSLQDGIFTDKNGKAFNGIMEFKNKDGNLVQNLYKDGQITEIKKDGILTRTIKRNNYSTLIEEYDKNGEVTKYLQKILRDDHTYIKQSDKSSGILKERHSLIPNDKSFVQINETGNVDGKDLITSHKIFDTKTKQVIQEGTLSFDTAVYGKEGAIVVQNGNKRYIFKANNGEADALFPNIAQGKEGAPSCTPSIEEILPDGTIKYVNNYKRIGSIDDNPVTGFKFPSGEEIYIDTNTISIKEKILNGKGTITGQTYTSKNRGQFVCIDGAPTVIQASYPRAAEKSLSCGLGEPLEQDTKDMLFNFYKKFALRPEDIAAFRPEGNPSRVTTEEEIKKMLELGLPKGYSETGSLSFIKQLLEYLEARGI